MGIFDSLKREKKTAEAPPPPRPAKKNVAPAPSTTKRTAAPVQSVPKPAPTTTSKVIEHIEHMKQLIEQLEKKENHLQQRAQSHLAQAVEYKRNGDTTRAMRCMKQKQMIEHEMQRTGDQILTLQKQLYEAERASSTKKIQEALEQGVQIRKDNLVDVERLDDVVGQGQELDAQQQEVDELFKQAQGHDYDDDELLKSLDNEILRDRLQNGPVESAAAPSHVTAPPKKAPAPAAKVTPSTTVHDEEDLDEEAQELERQMVAP